ncbi:hypothetical protein BMS3Bbin06_01585 [bacterium BMS3Bbin06]|nr:hypothetical protein BMS3Abin08_00720 [bacterium BMS3Abin08]GBE35051.1 hypothetical protein BMS3Bbin06_01585 [bacterium BMS3Bbin06]HDO34740.1 hypothetical protein [Nitrospirota bacterium]HDY70169.1 hypothetical protein [Nitrospirota bacterium]
MNLGNIFKESVDIVRKNLMIILPPIIVSVIITALMLVMVGGAVIKTGTTSSMPSAGGVALYSFIIGMIGFVLQAFAQGVTIAMAVELIEKGKGSLRGGMDTALSKVASLIATGFIYGLLVTLGMALFFIPGLIVAYIFMFSFVIIILSDAGAIGALRGSFNTVKGNFGPSLALFASLLGMGLLVGIVNTALGRIPLIGHAIGMVLMGGFLAFISVSMVKGYMILTGGKEGQVKETATE